MSSKYERYNHRDDDDPRKEPEHDEHPLDRNSLLEKYGFASNKCQVCQKTNSDIDGLLIQCGKVSR